MYKPNGLNMAELYKYKVKQLRSKTGGFMGLTQAFGWILIGM